MSRQRVLLAALGVAMLGVLGAALMLVMSDPGAPAGPTDDAAAPAVAPPDEVEQEADTDRRRHAGYEGTASIVGRLVRGKERAPVAAGAVRLDREGLPGWSVTSDESGRFRFERLPHGGPFRVSAVAADCAPVSLPGLALDRHQELDVGDLRLDRAVSITVVVTTLDERPLEGALVEAFAEAEVDWSSDWTKRLAQVGIAPVAVASLRTDAEGEAHFPALAAGSWGFRASMEGFARRGATSRKLTPEDEEGREPLTIPLWPGHSLTGRVLDADETPIPGALVLGMKANQAWSPNTAPLHHRVLTDEEGRYALEGISAGELAVWAGKPGGIPAQIAILTVPDLETFDIRLRFGGVLEGTVTEAGSGTPVPDVEVRALGWQGQSQRLGVAVTDAEGRYCIDSMLEGMINQVTVDRPGWVQVYETGTPWRQIALPAGSVTHHDITIRAGAVVTGVVRGPDGPVGGASVTIHGTQPGGGWGSKSAKTDSAGRYRVEGLDEGRGMIRVSAAGLAHPGVPTQWWQAMNENTVPDSCAVTIPATGEVEKNVELVPGVRVSGVVRGAGGEPLAGAKVHVAGTAGNEAAETDAEGAFEVTTSQVDGDSSVNASAEGYVSGTQSVTIAGSDVTDVVVELRPRPTLRGTVTTPGGGVPAGATVRLARPSESDSGNPWSWQDPERRWDGLTPIPVRADGTFETPLPYDTGKVVVRAEADGFAPTDGRPVELTQGRDAYETTIELGPGETFVCRVIDAASKAPVAGALVAVGTEHPQAQQQPWVLQNMARVLRGVADAEGRCEVRWPGPGKLSVTAEAAGYVYTTKSAKLPQERALDIELSPEMTIAGVVRDLEGQPVKGVQISYMSTQPRQFYTSEQVVSGDDGSFEIRNLSAGTYNLTAQSGWYGIANVRTKQIPSVTAGTQDLEIVVEPGLSIAGKVLDPEGKGLANTWLNAQPEGDRNGNWLGANTKSDGSFEILGLAEGTYTLHVNDGQGAQATQVKGIAAGTKDVVVRLQEGLEIRGEVVDEQGKPLSGENVYAVRLDQEQGGERMGTNMSQTAADGTFTLRGLAPGDYSIQRNAGRDAKTRNHVLVGGERIAAGSTGVRLVLSEGGKITGVVVDASGAPVRDVKSMWVRYRLTGTESGEKFANVGSDGRFAVTGLADGMAYDLRTMGGGFRPSAAGPFVTGSEDVRIAVETGLSCSGRLVDTRGDGIPKTNVMFRDPESGDYVWVQTDADGGFEVRGLTEGSYDITAFVPILDGEGNRTGQQRNVSLGKAEAGATGLVLEVPDE